VVGPIGYISRVSFYARISAVCGAVAFVGMACGGIEEPDLFSAGGSTSTVDSGTSSGKDSGVARDSGSGGGTSDSGGGTGPVDSGVIPPPPPTGIYCGDNAISGDPTTCTGSDICCVTGENIQSPTFACGAETTCRAAGNLVIPCDNGAECAGGKICCGTFSNTSIGGGGYYTQVRCASTCKGTDARTFCDPANGDADCTSTVSPTSTCSASGALPGFHVCS